MDHRLRSTDVKEYRWCKSLKYGPAISENPAPLNMVPPSHESDQGLAEGEWYVERNENKDKMN